jgi:hypothetical protein
VLRFLVGVIGNSGSCDVDVLSCDIVAFFAFLNLKIGIFTVIFFSNSGSFIKLVFVLILMKILIVKDNSSMHAKAKMRMQKCEYKKLMCIEVQR